MPSYLITAFYEPREAAMEVDIDIVMDILIGQAQERSALTYGGLSEAYHARTGDWHDPHGSWDHPLGTINNRLAANGAPPLSALVVLQKTNEPGGQFWGSAPTVPARPRDPMERLTAWTRLVEEVYAYEWE